MFGQGGQRMWRDGWRGYALGVSGLVVVTALAETNRTRLSIVTIDLVYLLIVLAAATVGGLVPGIVISIAAFLTFNYFFLPPYYTFIVGAPQDTVALFVFLIVAAVASNLVTRLRARERDAERRASESETLSQLGAALLSDVTLDTVLATVVEKVTTLFGFESAAILLPDAEETLHLRHVFPPDAESQYRLGREHTAVAAHVFSTGVTAGIGSPRRAYRPHGPDRPANATQNTGRRVLYVPVQTAKRAVGVLGVAMRRSSDYTPDERRILGTFANEAALAIDRARLTEEATRAAALQEADELKTALLAAVSHDLRTPLASIKASASSLLQEDVQWDAATQREFLTAIDEETDRLARLVGNLLDLTRIEGGALKPEKEWYEIGELIASVTDRLAPQIRTHALSVEITPDLPPVAFDFVEIGQVLTNLIENAAKYSEAGTPIVVRAGRDTAQPGFVLVQVCDGGFGIPPADLPYVFDPFYRVQRTAPERRRIAGSGIGLAICKGFVEAHGGTISVVSPPGEGSTFTFSLPVGRGDEAPGIEQGTDLLRPLSSSLGPSGRGKR